MILSAIPANAVVFVDANIFVYAFAPHPTLGPPSLDFIERIERGEIDGRISAFVLNEVAHQMMIQEAAMLFGWPMAGITRRLKNHPGEVQRLSRYRQAIDEISLLGLQLATTTVGLVSRAADLSRQHGLLCNDALLLATMESHGVTLLASNDADFDRVPGITRYAPV